MKRKRTIRGLYIWLLVLALMTPRRIVAEEAGNISMVSTQPYNIMLLIDKSGSMNGTDKQRLALSAACQFVDQLSTTYGDKVLTMQVGALAFGQMTEEVSPLLNLDTEENTTFLKDEINKIEYNPSGTGGTDLGVALRDAANVLKESEVEDARNAIVLFTDGFSENVLDAAASAQALEEAYAGAKELDSEIYIVGLNQANRIRAEGQDEIHRIADTAQTGEGLMERAENDTFTDGGLVNYLITDNMNDVREFYIALYAHMFETEWEYVDNHEFEIETGGVLEANVTVYSETEITDVKVLDPEGNSMTEDDETYVVSGDSLYKVIRIMEPEIGTWTVYVTSKDDNYKTYVVRFYGVEAAVAAKWGSSKEYPDCGLAEANAGQVTVTPMFRDEPYRDEAFANGLIEKEFSVTRGKLTDTYPLKYDKKSGTFVGYFPIPQDGDYHIKATLSDYNMSRTVECDLSADVPEPKKTVSVDIGPYEMKKGESVLLDTQELTGVNGLNVKKIDIDSAAKGNPDDVVTSFEIKGAYVTLNGQNKGTDRVQITAFDEDGNEYILTGQIKVKRNIPWTKILYIASAVLGGGLAVFWLVFLILRMLDRGKRAEGSFDIVVEDREDNHMEASVSTYPKGRSFSLWELINTVISDCQADPVGSAKNAVLLQKLEDESKEISPRRLEVVKVNKVKTYKLKVFKSYFNLNRSYICYKSRNFLIRVKFTPASENY